MVNKTPKIMEHLLDCALLKSYCYKLVHNRAKETVGGVLLKLGMKHKHLHVKPYSSFELTMVKLFRNKGKSLLLVCIPFVIYS